MVNAAGCVVVVAGISLTEMETELLEPNAKGIARAAALLRAGEVVALPTETVYGLAANALDAQAVARIYTTKGRPADNPLIVHVTGSEQAAELVTEIPPAAEALMAAFWPGPLTIVLPKRDLVPAITTATRPDVALRAPAHPAFQEVLAASGLVLAAPSANVAGRPSPTSAEHVMTDLAGKIPAILDGGEASIGVESTVIALTGGEPRVLRPGGISVAQLSDVIGRVTIDDAVLSPVAADFLPGAPGMKYRHYSPRTPLIAISGPLRAQIDLLTREAATKSIGIMSFDDDAAAFTPLPTISYGRHDDADSQARQLYTALRAVDDLGVDLVYVQIPERNSGISAAIRNRLLKATGHQIISLN